MRSTDIRYLKTRAGVLRLALLVTGFITFLLAGAGIDGSVWARTGKCNIWNCPRPWLVQAGISILAITWLFAVIMFSFVQHMTSNSTFRTMDSIGHCFSGVSLITAFGLFTTFAVMGLLYHTCDDKSFNYGDDIEERVLKYECDEFEAHRGKLLQPVLFGLAGATSLVSGIIALVLSRVAGESDHEPLAAMVMTTRKLIH